jgi:hypothetical protein
MVCVPVAVASLARLPDASVSVFPAADGAMENDVAVFTVRLRIE